MSRRFGTYDPLVDDHVDVRVFGADTTDADCTASFQAAADAAAGVGGVVFIPAGTWNVAGTVTVKPGVQVTGVGAGATVLNHTGNGVCLDFNLDGSFTVVNALRGVQINGNSGAAGVGVRVSDTWGFIVEDVLIDGYTGGIGFQLFNDSHWTEGTSVTGLRVRNCAVGVSFTRSAASTFDSFGYTRFRNVGINVPENGVGVRFGDSLNAADHYIYHSEFHMNFWLGASATAMAFDGDTKGEFNQLFVTGEKESGASSTRVWSSQAPGFWRFGGAVRVDADTKSYPANCYQNLVFTEDPDQRAVTFRAAGSQNASVPVAVFESSNGTVNASVYEWGGVVGVFLGVGDGEDGENTAYLKAGNGSPEGAVDGNVGFLYLRLDGGSGTTLYVKESGTDTNTGWVAK